MFFRSPGINMDYEKYFMATPGNYEQEF